MCVCVCVCVYVCVCMYIYIFNKKYILRIYLKYIKCKKYIKYN